MLPTSQVAAVAQLLPPGVDVVQIRGGPKIGQSEITLPADQEVEPDADDTRPFSSSDLEEAKAYLDALVDACRGPDDDRNSFRKHKEQLISDLADPYALFRFVKAHPELVPTLREHKALKDRIRKIPKAKIALLSIHCKMRPGNDEEKKSCSEWTIWLEQADHENILPNDFITWGMNASFQDCRRDVRDRRRAAKMAGDQPTVAAGRAAQLIIRETANGADVTLRRKHFSITKAVMKKLMTMIERAAPEGLLDSSNDNDASGKDE